MKENLWPIRASLNHHHSSASSSCNNFASSNQLLLLITSTHPLLLRSSIHVLHHHHRVLSSIPTTTTPTFVPSRGVNGGRFVSRTAPRDYYQVLGVPRTATQAEIKKAFYTMSKKYHPDVVGSNEASAKKFLEVKEAYDTLKDEQKRKEYDLRNPPPGARRQASSNDYHSYDYWQQRMAEQERVRQQQQYGSAGSHQSSSSSDGWNQDWKRVWERMQQDQDFRRAAEDLNERLRRMREQQFYQQQAKRTTAGGGNPQDPSEQAAPPTPGWPGSAGMIRLIQRVILIYILVSLFIALLRPNRAADPSQMQPPRNWQEWEQRRRIEEMMRKMPWDEKPK